MRKWYWSIFLVNATLVFVTVVSSGVLAQSQGPQHAAVLVPDSTVERPQDKGIRAHTNHLIRLQTNPTPNALSPSGETPQTIRPVYKLPSTGGSQKIAIVDAFDYPTAENDLKVFSARFGLPPMYHSKWLFQEGLCQWHETPSKLWMGTGSSVRS